MNSKALPLKQKQVRYISTEATLPYLGIQEADFAIFEYIPLDIHFPNFNVIMPTWLTEQGNLSLGQCVTLNLSIVLPEGIFSSGKIVSFTESPTLKSHVTTIELEVSREGLLPLLLSHPDLSANVSNFDYSLGLARYFLSTVEDCIILKKGILIYLSHLMHLFKRIVKTSSEDFSEFRSIIFDDILSQTQGSIAFLSEYLSQLHVVSKDTDRDAISLEETDLEIFFQHFHQPIPLNLVELALENELVSEYIRSIRLLERKMYADYNALIAAYTIT